MQCPLESGSMLAPLHSMPRRRPITAGLSLFLQQINKKNNLEWK
jgi:hypothetical protein